ncbi:MAG: right-handed parallel beta-helix repeat-containing protein, partial [Bacteroidetes bacterium]|nr:right-handed parallel beta-helix repeat-containing protein [Bacteroidota bacterium]
MEKSKNASVSYNLIENGIEINKLIDTTFIVGNKINGGIDYSDLEGSIIVSGNTFKDSTFENKFNFDSFEKTVFSNNHFPTGGKDLFINLNKIGFAEINYNKHVAPIYINMNNTGLQLNKKNTNPLIEIIGNEVIGDTVGTIIYNGAELQIPIKINLNKKFGVTAEKTYNAQIIDNYLLRVLDLSYLRGETQIKQNKAYAGAKIKHVNDDAVKQSRIIIEDNTFRDDTTEIYNKTALKIKHVLKGTAQINSHLIKSNRFDGNYSYKIGIDSSDFFTISNNIVYGTLSFIKVKESEIKENAFQVIEGKPAGNGINLFDQCENIKITDNLIGGFSQDGISIMSDVKNIEINNNKIGTDEDGLVAVPNRVGISLYKKCSNIIIDGNLISGNSAANVKFYHDCSNNIIRNNIIGPNAAITERFTNTTGIQLERNCDGNLIEYNILSGLAFAIEIKDRDKTSCDNNIIDNNHFGISNLDPGNFSNMVKLMNLSDIVIKSGIGNRIENNYSPAHAGFLVLDGSNSKILNNVLGMVNDGEMGGVSGLGFIIEGSDNLIEYNTINSCYAIMLGGNGTSRNTVKNNKIGINKSGTKLISPLIGVSGISVAEQASSNTISNNIIGGNSIFGILIIGVGTKFNSIQDNIIGTDQYFSKRFQNKNGIVLINAANNIIRHNTIGHADTLSNAAIFLIGEETKYNLLYGNQIGTSSTGIPKITNYYGILSANTSANTISENKIWYNYTGLAEENSNNIYHDNDVQFNYGNTGVSLNNSHSTFTGNIIANDSTDGFKCKNGSNPTIINNNIFNNQGFGLINIDPSVTVNAQNNWWGDPSGPSGSGPGTGNAVQGNIAFQNWLTQGINLTLKTSVDTLFSKPNQTDSVFLFYKNHNNPADTLKLTISSNKNWIISDTVLIVDLDSTGAGKSKILFSVPSNALIDESAKVFVNAVSQSDSFLTTNDSLIVRLYSGELTYLIVNPDSIECEPGDTLQFFATGYDQHQNQIPIQVVWQSTGGSIDTTGKYTAGSIPGIYYAKVFDPGSSIADSAIIKIKGQPQIPTTPILTSPLNNSAGISAESV